MMIRYLFFLLFILNTVLGYELDPRQVSDLQREVESKIQNSLSSITNLESFYINAQVEIDKTKIDRQKYKIPKKINKENMGSVPFPGLALIEEEIENIKLEDENEILNIKPYVKSIRIRVNIADEGVDTTKLTSITRSIIKNTFPEISQDSFRVSMNKVDYIKTKSKREPASEKEEVKEARSADTIPNSQDKKDAGSLFNEFYVENIILILLGTFLIGAIIWSFRKVVSMLSQMTRKISSSLSNIDINMPSQSLNEFGQKDKEDIVLDGKSNELSEGLQRKINESIKEDKQLAISLFSYLLDKNEHPIAYHLFLNLNSVDKKQVKEFVPANNWSRFLENIQTLQTNSHKVKVQSILLDLLHAISIDQITLLHVIAKSLLRNLSPQQYQDFFKDLTDAEKVFSLKFLSAESLAEQINRDHNFINYFINVEGSQTTAKDLKNLVDNLFELTSLSPFAEDEKTEDPIEKKLLLVGEMLPCNLESRLFSETRISRNKMIESFDSEDLALVLSFIETISPFEAASLLETLTQNMKDQVLDGLPDITAARIKSKKGKVDQSALNLKARLWKIIRGSRISDKGEHEENSYAA